MRVSQAEQPISCVLEPRDSSLVTNGWGSCGVLGFKENVTGKSRPLEERFWEKVDKAGDCWLWTAGKARGYGYIRLNGRTQAAHRVAYAMLVGPIPEGLTLDHLCRNPACVNPAHLEVVSLKENILRGIGASAQHARQTHCIRGHPFDEENTYWCSDGRRQCRACHREQARVWKQRQRTQARDVEERGASDQVRATTPSQAPRHQAYSYACDGVLRC